MDPTRAGGFTHFLQDLDDMPMFSNSSIQPALFPAFPFAHVPFPSFCTQPPPAPPTGAAATAIDAGISAWLNNSIDPIQGNARKGETYWTKVAETFNATTPEGRKREMHHLKGHWHKTTKKPWSALWGSNRAKKGKGNADEVAVEVKEHLKALVDAQSTQKEEMEGMKEFQQKLSDQRVEAANLQLKAAQEKEAKMLDHKNKLL
ncbi:hypothetical protein E2562_034480 [Oryza meyeriana var. granulata]|uniref:No apical meristem-associated C-terminal domain-containing protein n=1 Tax=Oryza meyeriana var. granulata TaxID=110450 RepID=A0A6G1CW47_9ORYZ|nr:hypothetical protein E2562_034480 [Oryza meyeriana var. granulata]